MRLNNKAVFSSFFLLGLVIYAYTFNSSFHFDDFNSIVNNSSIWRISRLAAIWNFWPTRFVVYFSLAVNFYFGKLNTFGYHLFNFAAHLAAASSVYWFTLLSFSTPALKGKEIAKHGGLIAFFSGLIFLAHPVQTESVTYIIQRAACLATLFYILSLCFYAKYCLNELEGKKRPSFYYLSLLSLVLAMYSKEMAITLPLAVLLYEFCFLSENKANWKRTVPFLATLLIIPFTMLISRSVDFAEMKRTLGQAPGILPWHYLLTQFKVIVKYISLLFWPIKQNLLYSFPISKTFWEFPTAGCLVLLITIFSLAVRIFGKYRIISFSIFWFFITLFPESGLIPIKDVIFEHRLYLPMAGFTIFLASFFYYIFKNNPKRAFVALVLIVFFYSVLTIKRNFIWENELSLWNDVVMKSPALAAAYNNRGTSYRTTGSFKSAFSDFDKAMELKPDFAEPYNNRGNLYFWQGDFEKALSDYDRAILLNPFYADAFYNRANTYYLENNFPAALSDYARVIEINRGYFKAYYNRSIIFRRQNNLRRALFEINRSIAINPADTNSYFLRAEIYYLMNNYSAAGQDVSKAEKLGGSINKELRSRLKNIGRRK